MNKKLRRSHDQFVGGVCAGFANYFGWNVTRVRIVFTLLSLFLKGYSIILYVVLWAVIPLEDSSSEL